MKIVKLLLFYLFAVVTLPMILLTKISNAFGGDEVFVFTAQALSLVPGRLGSYLRVSYYHYTTTETAKYCFIGFGTFFSKQDIKIGEGVSIGAYCVIGCVQIGEGTLIASRVSIPSGRHQHSGDTPDDTLQNSMKIERIKIGARCWVGESALVLADVGDGSVIGGGSVVVNNISQGAVAVGNPARVIKSQSRCV